MIRLGLCCKFREEPIKFRTTTARHIVSLSPAARIKKVSQLCLDNAYALLMAINYCHSNRIGSFRVNSQILPLKTHPDLSYDIKQLPQADEIESVFRQCGLVAAKNNIRLTFHPDQFILLSSPNKEVTRKSIQELEYQAEVSEWIGADVINIHGGGAYGDKKSALDRVACAVDTLNKSVRKRLTFENDDRVYTPSDLLPLCEKTGIPLVYDVHHHRCLSDKLTIEKVTDMAIRTWDREPLFHISSPKFGWKGKTPNLHHDYIDINDFPDCWRNLDITVEVEAKAKELAVKKLRRQLSK